MKSIGTFEAKTHFGQLLTEVERTGAGITIQRRGRKVALLIPYRDNWEVASAPPKESVVEVFWRIRAAQKQTLQEEGCTANDYITEGRER